MSTAFYDSMAALAARLLEKFGRTVIITRSSATRNPVTGVVTPGATATFEVKGINKVIPKELIDGTRVLASDRMLILEGAVEPRLTDLIDGWSVQEVQSVKPAATDVVHFARIRK